MPTPDDLAALLTGRRGHFRMESGYHSDQWYDLDRLLADRDRLAPFVRQLALRLSAHRLDGVCGPATGGAELAARIAGELGIHVFHTERFVPPGATGLFPVRYTVPPDQRDRVRHLRLALVDDAISAGSAVRGSFADLQSCGAQVVVLGALFVFGHRADAFVNEHRLALEALARPPFSVWSPSECPLCCESIPLIPFL